MAKKQQPWQYGDPAPTNWKQAAELLKLRPAVKKKLSGTSLMERLDIIERMLKDKK